MHAEQHTNVAIANQLGIDKQTVAKYLDELPTYDRKRGNPGYPRGPYKYRGPVKNVSFRVAAWVTEKGVALRQKLNEVVSKCEYEGHLTEEECEWLEGVINP